MQGAMSQARQMDWNLQGDSNNLEYVPPSGCEGKVCKHLTSRGSRPFRHLAIRKITLQNSARESSQERFSRQFAQAGHVESAAMWWLTCRKVQNARWQ